MSTNLNYKVEGQGQPIVLIHGLFGNLDNLGLLARDFKQDHQVISIDLRNHGASFHHHDHDYGLMAQDVAHVITSLQINNIILVGHSMGGKVAMTLAQQAPQLISRLVVMDIAPVNYQERRHDSVFAGLFAVLEKKPTTRQQAMQILAHYINLEGVRQFLGKSLFSHNGQISWRFNVQHLYDNYHHIIGWTTQSTCLTPTLFLKGGESDYITAAYQSEIRDQFPNAKAHIIANTGHWLHAEKPAEVIRAIRKFINQN
jgi:esterase